MAHTKLTNQRIHDIFHCELNVDQEMEFIWTRPTALSGDPSSIDTKDENIEVRLAWLKPQEISVSEFHRLKRHTLYCEYIEQHIDKNNVVMRYNDANSRRIQLSWKDSTKWLTLHEIRTVWDTTKYNKIKTWIQTKF